MSEKSRGERFRDWWNQSGPFLSSFDGVNWLPTTPKGWVTLVVVAVGVGVLISWLSSSSA